MKLHEALAHAQTTVETSGTQIEREQRNIWRREEALRSSEEVLKAGMKPLERLIRTRLTRMGPGGADVEVTAVTSGETPRLGIRLHYFGCGNMLRLEYHLTDPTMEELEAGIATFVEGWRLMSGQVQQQRQGLQERRSG